MKIDKQERRQCSGCRKKILLRKLERYYYPLLHRYAYHCDDCLKERNGRLFFVVAAT
jgi:hypothetical protein